MKHDFEQIYESTLKFLAPLSPEETYKIIVREALRLVGANDGSLYVSEQGSLHCVYTTQSKNFRFSPRKEGFTTRAFKTKKPIVISKTEMVKVHPEAKDSVMESFFCIPLAYQSYSLGVLNLESRKKNYFDERKLKLLKLYGSLASLAIQKTVLYSQTKEALQLRDRFIALASHEIKTPLTSVSLYTQLIEHKVKEGKIPEERIWIKVTSNLRRIGSLLNEFMDTEKAKMGHLNFTYKSMNLLVLVKNVVIEYRMTYPKLKFKISFVAKNDPVFTADREKLRLVIVNILNNAVKFSPPTGTVFVTLRETGEAWILSIKDEGPGINKNDQAKILEPFYKGKDNTKDGLGLGLYLSKTIIDNHHGTLSIFSDGEHGTDVQIALPKLHSL